MAVLPTDFSVSSTRSSPIPNPDTSVSIPVIKDAEDSASVDKPSAKNAQIAATLNVPLVFTGQDFADIVAPSAITSSVTDLVAPPFPLNHARILYENELFNYSSITANVGNSNVNLSTVPNTFQRWAFSGAGAKEVTIVLPSAVQMDSVAICAHNIGGSTIETDYAATLGGSFSEFAPDKTSSSANTAIMVHRTSGSVSVRELKIRFSTGAGDFYVGYIMAGVALQMQRPFFSGHTPITDATVTKFYDSWTESGNIIGRSKRSQGQETNADFKNIDDGWYRNYFQGFEKSALTLPYFFAWNLLEYPDDVGLCFTDTDISAPYSGVRNLRSISFPMKGAL